MQVRAGTSGWSYVAWRGRFYPADLPTDRMLRWYAATFDTVEVNATSYRMPRAEVLARWRGQVPDGFQFALKAPQWMARLGRDAGRAMAAFDGAAAALGPALGPMLFRPPPGAADPGWLRELLALLPRGRRAALEVRAAEWLRDDVLAALSDAGVALCITDSEEIETPLVATARFGYLRLRRVEYDGAALAGWAERIGRQPWDEAFVFFRHEDEARGPGFARAFLSASDE